MKTLTLTWNEDKRLYVVTVDGEATEAQVRLKSTPVGADHDDMMADDITIRIGLRVWRPGGFASYQLHKTAKPSFEDFMRSVMSGARGMREPETEQ